MKGTNVRSKYAAVRTALQGPVRRCSRAIRFPVRRKAHHAEKDGRRGNARKGVAAHMTGFDQGRFEALVLWIAHETKDDPNFGRTKLAKVLFYSDFDAFREDGAPMTGATYARYPYGPFPVELERTEKSLVAAGDADLKDDVPEGEEKKLYPLRDPPDVHALFDQWQITNVSAYITRFSNQSSGQVSDDSHKLPGWLMVAARKPIPYETAFLPTEPPSDDQVQRGLRLARRRGWLTDDGWICERESP